MTKPIELWNVMSRVPRDSGGQPKQSAKHSEADPATTSEHSKYICRQ